MALFLVMQGRSISRAVGAVCRRIAAETADVPHRQGPVHTAYYRSVLEDPARPGQQPRHNRREG